MKGNKRDATEEAKEADNSIIDGDNISDQQKKQKLPGLRDPSTVEDQVIQWQIHEGFCYALKNILKV